MFVRATCIAPLVRTAETPTNAQSWARRLNFMKLHPPEAHYPEPHSPEVGEPDTMPPLAEPAEPTLPFNEAQPGDELPAEQRPLP